MGILLLCLLAVADGAVEAQTPIHEFHFYYIRPGTLRCGVAIPCIAPGCIPAPTALPAVDVSRPGDYGTVSSNCGAKRFLFVLWVPCGPPLMTEFC